MLYSLTGELKRKDGRFIIVGVYGFEFKVAIPLESTEKLPPIGKEIRLFTFLHVREDGADLYGFLSEAELKFFESLISVTGIGPKSALSILSVAPAERLTAAIASGGVDLLQKSSGIGRKTAERIVLELKDKVSAGEGESIEIMEADSDIVEALVGLGYPKNQAKEAVRKIHPDLIQTSDRLRDALKILSSRKS